VEATVRSRTKGASLAGARLGHYEHGSVLVVQQMLGHRTGRRVPGQAVMASADDNECRVDVVGETSEAGGGFAAFLVVGPGDAGVGERGGDALTFSGDVAVPRFLERVGVGVDTVILEGDRVGDMQVRTELVGKVDCGGERRSPAECPSWPTTSAVPPGGVSACVPGCSSGVCCPWCLVPERSFTAPPHLGQQRHNSPLQAWRKGANARPRSGAPQPQPGASPG